MPTCNASLSLSILCIYLKQGEGNKVSCLQLIEFQSRQPHFTDEERGWRGGGEGWEHAQSPWASRELEPDPGSGPLTPGRCPAPSLTSGCRVCVAQSWPWTCVGRQPGPCTQQCAGQKG